MKNPRFLLGVVVVETDVVDVESVVEAVVDASVAEEVVVVKTVNNTEVVVSSAFVVSGISLGLQASNSICRKFV